MSDSLRFGSDIMALRIQKQQGLAIFAKAKAAAAKAKQCPIAVEDTSLKRTHAEAQGTVMQATPPNVLEAIPHADLLGKGLAEHHHNTTQDGQAMRRLKAARYMDVAESDSQRPSKVLKRPSSRRTTSSNTPHQEDDVVLEAENVDAETNADVLQELGIDVKYDQADTNKAMLEDSGKHVNDAPQNMSVETALGTPHNDHRPEPLAGVPVATCSFKDWRIAMASRDDVPPWAITVEHWALSTGLLSQSELQVPTADTWKPVNPGIPPPATPDGTPNMGISQSRFVAVEPCGESAASSTGQQNMCLQARQSDEGPPQMLNPASVERHMTLQELADKVYITTTNKGGEKLVVPGFGFNKKRTHVGSGTVEWKCDVYTTPGCKATCVTRGMGQDLQLLTDPLVGHCHAARPGHFVERAMAQRVKKAAQSMDGRNVKCIVADVMSQEGIAQAIVPADETYLSRVAWRCRHKARKMELRAEAAAYGYDMPEPIANYDSLEELSIARAVWDLEGCKQHSC